MYVRTCTCANRLGEFALKESGDNYNYYDYTYLYLYCHRACMCTVLRVLLSDSHNNYKNYAAYTKRDVEIILVIGG